MVSSRTIKWDYGELSVQQFGAMLAPVRFFLPNGKTAGPMHLPHWSSNPNLNMELPGIIRHLRGEWPCVPFGIEEQSAGFTTEWSKLIDDDLALSEPHGFSSNHKWQWKLVQADSLSLEQYYPYKSPVEKLERKITPDPGKTAVDIELKIMMKRACSIPLGLHGVFHLNKEVGSNFLEPGNFEKGWTYPGVVEKGRELFRKGTTFDYLADVPGWDSNSVDATRIPFEKKTEALLQLTGVDGHFSLLNKVEGYRTTLTWDKNHFPSVLLWYSNGGREYEPWDGKNISIGIEPICSAFGLGEKVSSNENPISKTGITTALKFEKSVEFITKYRIEVSEI